MFDCLEEAFVFAATYGPAYIMEQLINQELNALTKTGAFSTAFIEWAGADPAGKTHVEFKIYFGEAHESRLQVGLGTANDHGYHGVANAMDDDSLGSITSSMTQMQMTNKTPHPATTMVISNRS